MNLKSTTQLAAAVLAMSMVVFCAPRVWSQAGGGEVSAKMAENAKVLKQYTYLQKTQVFFRGELTTTKLDQVHYDSMGEKISIPISSTTPEEEQQRRAVLPVGRMVQRRVAEKKEEMKEEMKQYIERLVGLMGQYLPPNPDRVKAAMAKADITPPSGDADAKVAMHDFLKPGDSVKLSISSATEQPSEISIHSTLDDDPVSFVVSFNKLPDGTNYPELTTINSDAKELEMRISTLDYHK